MKEQLEPIFIKIEPSLILMGLLLAISILSCTIIFIMPLDIGFKLGLCILIMLTSGYFILRDSLKLLPWSWQSLSVSNNGELTITNNSGQQFKPSLQANSFIHEHLVILNFKHARYKNPAPPVIFLNIQGNDMRKLRVWLRWFKHHKTLEILQ